MKPMITVLASLFLACLSQNALASQVFLFPYFDSNGENGVYLAWSADGRQFHAVNHARPIFVPPAWRGQALTRDPSIVYGAGKYHMVWTSNWGGNCLGYAWSPDLVTWSAPRRIEPFPEGAEQPKNVWAPELLVDQVAGDFKIIWSSTLPSELADQDGSEDTHGNDHRIYYLATKDFESFTEPKLAYQDENYSVIDAQVTWDADHQQWLMALKPEVPPERDGKNIRLAVSPKEIKPESFGGTTPPVVGPGASVSGKDWAEGPSLVHHNNQWLLYWDTYGSGRYSLATSTYLKTWHDETDQLRMPTRHPRHGTVFLADPATVGWDLK
ncbi:MAG: glycoside hydrolase family 43 protein [Planctomycetales bacterium]|nr:glycoside hydrolase family 43 protein [Planctomycetales bacterium]